MRKNTRMVYIETPTNPLMSLDRHRGHQSEFAAARKSNWWWTTLSCRPTFSSRSALGADMVVHSTTKFLNGHSDGLGGVVVCTTPDQADQLAFVQKAAGAILSPFECWLILARSKNSRGTHGAARSQRPPGRRLPRRPQESEESFLSRIDRSSATRTGATQMTGFGSMITFETGSSANAKKMLKKVRVCSLGESLGGVETLISHPATMTHAALGEKGRKEIGITDGMVRISVGIENVEDIIGDLENALIGDLTHFADLKFSDESGSKSSLHGSIPKRAREWNSSEYHRLSQPQVSWGKKVLARLQLRGDELVLDAGAGTGRLTADLCRHCRVDAWSLSTFRRIWRDRPANFFNLNLASAFRWLPPTCSTFRFPPLFMALSARPLFIGCSIMAACFGACFNRSSRRLAAGAMWRRQKRRALDRKNGPAGGISKVRTFSGKLSIALALPDARGCGGGFASRRFH